MILDYNKIPKADAIPEADAMIETFRAIGYTLETAVADIIDNSITAGAKNVWITRTWDGDKSSLCVKDDGHGMNNDECIQAMRPGSKNPMDKRDENDLGRFGLGLKTASFSQCRRLTLVSKRKGEKEVFWTWDLDFVDKEKKWQVLKWMPIEYKDILKGMTQGTAVIWTEMDRVIPEGTICEDDGAKTDFYNQLDKLKQHIRMTFHRFIEDGDIDIHWGLETIKPWNPFFLEEPKTQTCPVDDVSFNDEIVNVKGYVLPHKDDFSSEEAFRSAFGLDGYMNMAGSGFYIYRNRRLLVAGNWLGLFKEEEQHYKLVRVMVDLPNTLDSDWKIDIKKSTATPPYSCMGSLRRYAQDVRRLGKKVYVHKGKEIRYKAGQKFQHIWKEIPNGNRVRYEINPQSGIIKSLRQLAEHDPRKAMDMLMNIVSNNIPEKAIYVRQAEEQEPIANEYSERDLKDYRYLANFIYKTKRQDGTPEEIIKDELRRTEPFDELEFIIDELHD